MLRPVVLWELAEVLVVGLQTSQVMMTGYRRLRPALPGPAIKRADVIASGPSGQLVSTAPRVCQIGTQKSDCGIPTPFWRDRHALNLKNLPVRRRDSGSLAP